MSTKEKLSRTANDYWYRLHEDYRSKKELFDDFTVFLDTEVALLKLMNEEELLDAKQNIGHDEGSGRNVVYSIMTAISACREWFPDELQAPLNELLAKIVDAFSVPGYAPYWEELYEGIDKYKKVMREFKKSK